MKQITVYKCDFCETQSTDKGSVFAHEAKHYGLTPETYQEWHRLRATAESAGAACGRSKNPRTDAEFDKACRDLAGFETGHGVEFGSPRFSHV